MLRIDYTFARGLVATRVGGRVFLGDDEGRDATGGIVRFDDVSKIAGQVAYAF